MNAYYNTALTRIGNNSESTRDLARDVLMWVTSSHEPMHVDTVLVALRNQALSRTTFASSQLIGYGHEFKLLDKVKQVRSISFPLLEITEAAIIQDVHCSVAAYITLQGTKPQTPNQCCR